MSQEEEQRYAQLVALEKRLAIIEERAADNEDDERPYSKYLTQLLQEVCKVVRDSDQSNASDLDAVVEKAAQLIDKGVHVGYDGADLFDFMPSFAHESKETLVQDSKKARFSRFTTTVAAASQLIANAMCRSRLSGRHDASTSAAWR